MLPVVDSGEGIDRLTRAHLPHVRLRLAAPGGFRLAALVAGLLVVLVLPSFLEDTGLLKLLLEAPQRLIERLVLADLDLSQTIHPFRTKMRV